MIEAYPLQWPIGYKRTGSTYRTSSPFRQSMDKAQRSLSIELKRIGASSVITSTNVPIRKDGMMYVEYMDRRLDDPGVAVYFKYKGKDVVMCCDKYIRVWENIYALSKGIEALRGMERWGVSEFLDRAFTGFKALPESIDQQWWQVLGINPDADPDQIKIAYRNLTKVHHPDAGGNVEMFNRINKAYQQAIATK